MTAEAKTKPKLAAKKKTITVGQTYRLKLKGVSGKAKVKWKNSKKSVVSIAKKKGNTVTLKAKKKGRRWLQPPIRKRNINAGLRLRQRKRRNRQQIIRY